MPVHVSHSLVSFGYIDVAGDRGQARLDLSRYVSPTATGTDQQRSLPGRDTADGFDF